MPAELAREVSAVTQLPNYRAGWPTGLCREFGCRIRRSCVCGFRITFAATNYASALTSSNNSCHSPDSLAPHLGLLRVFPMVTFLPHLLYNSPRLNDLAIRSNEYLTSKRLLLITFRFRATIPMESAPQQRSVAQPSSSTRSPRFFPNSASTQRPLRLFTLSLEGSVILCSKSTKTATLTTFRINTCKSVSKQTTLTPFRMNTYKKTGGRGYARQRNQQLPCSQLSQRPSYAPRSASIPCVLTRLRILPVATGVCSFELPASSVQHPESVVIAAGEFADDVAYEVFGVAE